MLATHDKPELKLGFKIGLELEFGFFCFFCKCLRTSLGTKSNSMVHDKLEFKFEFEIGPKLEHGFIFFIFCKCLQVIDLGAKSS
jgi:hypothetical protein